MNYSFDIVRLGSTEFIRWTCRNSKKIHFTQINTISDITISSNYKGDSHDVDFITSSGRCYTTIKFDELEEYFKTPVKAFI